MVLLMDPMVAVFQEKEAVMWRFLMQQYVLNAFEEDADVGKVEGPKNSFYLGL
jgi:hypothetical protein